MACNPEHASWGELNSSLLAYAILGSETGIQGVRPGSWCSLCQESDHKTTECALYMLEPVSTPPLIPPTPGPIKSSTRRGGQWRHNPVICVGSGTGAFHAPATRASTSTSVENASQRTTLQCLVPLEVGSPLMLKGHRTNNPVMASFNQ